MVQGISDLFWSGCCLEKGYQVRVFDNLSFGCESIVDFLNHDHFEFMKGDMRNEEKLSAAVKGIDFVAQLAAIVGDPACKKFPDDTRDINLDGSKNLYKLANAAG